MSARQAWRRAFFLTGSKRAAMKMNDLEVAVCGEEIVIAQTDGAGEQVVILISAEQAELVCEWIRGASKALQKSGSV
ncbi:hypothetical protein [Bordetella bronchiseptica]|uniref:hypothetical protein n=1 Tax=Bordetella bronchiseptica TaxID=518 RepID=UPI00126872F9|nr:hypothetical protein [Bordetella bronchiseptica]